MLIYNPLNLIGLAEVLCNVPKFAHVDLEEAGEHVLDPRPAVTSFPFGPAEPAATPPASQGIPSGTAGTRAAATGESTPGGHTGGGAAGRTDGQRRDGGTPAATKTEAATADPGMTPRHNPRVMKYGSARVPREIRRLARLRPQLCRGMTNKKWIKRFFRAGSNALTAGTWQSYTSAWHNFEAFCQGRDRVPKWPLDGKTLNGFVLWCAGERNLAPATIKAYVTGLKTLGVLLGGTRAVRGWDLTKFLLKGLANRSYRHTSRSKGSDPCCFEILKELKTQIDKSLWSDDSKQCIWTCCCVGYFGSLRGGELLAKMESGYDKYSDFIWGNLEDLEGGGKTIHVPVPKSGQRGGGGGCHC